MYKKSRAFTIFVWKLYAHNIEYFLKNILSYIHYDYTYWNDGHRNKPTKYCQVFDWTQFFHKPLHVCTSLMTAKRSENLLLLCCKNDMFRQNYTRSGFWARQKASMRLEYC